MKFRRFIAVIMACIFIVSMLAACGSGSSSSNNGDSGDVNTPAESFKIGVILYDTSIQWATDIMGCLNSLSEAFNVTFETAIGGTDPDETIASVQNFGAAGYDGIINLHPGTVMSTLVETCESYGMYIVTSNDPSNASADYAEFSASESFAGEVWEDEYDIAQMIVQEMYDAGAREFALHGFPEGLSSQMDTRLVGARDMIGSLADAEIVTEGLSFDKAAAAEDIISQFGNSIDAIFSSVETVSTVYQPLVNAGLNGAVLLNCYDPNDDVLTAFQDGTVSYCTAGTCADTMIAFVLLYNALTGNRMTQDDGSAASINMQYVICRNADDYQNVIDHVSGSNPPYSPSELAEYVVSMNPDATFDSLKVFAEAFSLDDVIARQG